MLFNPKVFSQRAFSQKARKKINVGISGGAGYGGTELIRILIFHPNVNLKFVTSRKYAGLKVSSVNRFLEGLIDLEYIEPDISIFPEPIDLIFFATPHKTSMEMVPRLVREIPEVSIIDLSGDYRLKDPDEYETYYGSKHSSPELLENFVYGIPELNRDKIRRARYIANPGCFATGIIFALYPLLKEGLIKSPVTVVSVTGSSGSGDVPKEVTHHPMRAKNFKAYKILEHQHLPEIKQFIRERCGVDELEMGFIPQSGPFVRGIFTTAVSFNPGLSQEEVLEAVNRHYRGLKFVRVVNGSPEVVMVYGTNYVEVSYKYRDGFIVGMSAIDNLVRGASGQAIQNMNLMFGFEEIAGIWFPGMKP